MGDFDDPDQSPTEAPSGQMMMATILEILMPPFSLIIAVILGLLLLSIITQRRWWRRRPSRCPCQVAKNVRKLSPYNSVGNLDNGLCSSSSSSSSSRNGRSQAVSASSTKKREGMQLLLTDEDGQLIEKFQRFQNTPWALFWLSLPCTVSLVFCPLALLLHSPMVSFFWPDDVWDEEIPKVNDVISCFLTPAGLVYAIAFGFAFQEALSKQGTVSTMVTTQMTTLEHMVALTLQLKMKSFTAKRKKEVVEILKGHVINWVKGVVHGKKKRCGSCGLSTGQDASGDGLLKILGVLQLVSHEDTEGVGGSSSLQQAMLEHLMNHVLQLDALSSNCLDQLHSRMQPLQWAFLETLGYFSFFGIVLTRADSYRLELCMCVLTVLSIAMFCYVLSDLDSLLHGVFRVDLSGVPGFLGKLQFVHQTLQVAEGNSCQESNLPSDGDIPGGNVKY